MFFLLAKLKLLCAGKYKIHKFIFVTTIVKVKRVVLYVFKLQDLGGKNCILMHFHWVFP